MTTGRDYMAAFDYGSKVQPPSAIWRYGQGESINFCIGNDWSLLKMNAHQANRPLSEHELSLARWMLEHGTPEAIAFVVQLDAAEVTAWKCPCGCASINFRIKGHSEAPPGVNVLSEFVVGEGDDLSGIFIFESGGLLKGIEVYGMTGDAPRSLPTPGELRSWSETDPR